MNWSQEELEQWTVTQQQKEEDSEAIERYAAQDRAKIKELDLAITRMNRTVAAQKGDLQREVTDTQSVQMQLRKAADDFESLHKASVPCAVCFHGCQAYTTRRWSDMQAHNAGEARSDTAVGGSSGTDAPHRCCHPNCVRVVCGWQAVPSRETEEARHCCSVLR